MEKTKLREMYTFDKEQLRKKEDLIISILNIYRKPNYMIIQSTISFLEPLAIRFLQLIRKESFRWLALPDIDKFINLVKFINDRIGED